MALRKKSKRKMGWVALVGAGPGDPSLLTLRGRDLLSCCDIVIYDALITPSLLSFAPQAKKKKLGKRADRPSVSQKSIEKLLIAQARAGNGVVHLKGGDPFIFGRGGEEIVALSKARIPFEMVPGVSAGQAVPAYAGIPLTHRALSSQVTFVTGHEAYRRSGRRVDWELLAKLSGTVVAFMGLRQLPDIVRSLTRGGLRPESKISVIEWGTTPAQNVISGTLADIERRVHKRGVKSPALAVIGEVNRFRPMLNWFEKRPLFGTQVVVTRAREQARALVGRLQVLGAQVIEYPTIEVREVPQTQALSHVFDRLSDFDYLVFTSPNGATHFWRHLEKSALDARCLAHIQIVAIGPQTEAVLKSLGIRADWVPRNFTTEGVLMLMKQKKMLRGKRILLARSDIASKELVEGLRRAGALEVKDVVIYRTRPPKLMSRIATDLHRNGTMPYLTFTSSSTVLNFVRAVGGGRKARAWARRCKIISIGPVTSKTVRTVGLRVAREAKRSTVESMIEAVIEDRTGQRFASSRTAWLSGAGWSSAGRALGHPAPGGRPLGPAVPPFG